MMDQTMGENNEMTLSVLMVTYNHESYIARSIESVLAQKTTFPIQLVIGEDRSTDGTAAIVKQYADRYPNIIKARFNPRNMGMSANLIKTLADCTGKYIAILDGDDHWTDPFKLQKQVDFLEANPEYSLCCHRYSIYNACDGSYSKDFCAELFTDDTKGIDIGMDMYFKYWLTKALTVVFRRNCFDAAVASKYKYFRDVHLFYHVLQYGKGRCINFNGGVYVRHEGGICSSISAMEINRVGYLVYKELYKINRSPFFKEKFLEDLKWRADFCLLDKKNYIYIFRLGMEPAFLAIVIKRILNKLAKVVSGIARRCNAHH
jgi:glycosyltransferase involved in cell wall biosynthesis